jgi:hypothetical protein
MLPSRTSLGWSIPACCALDRASITDPSVTGSATNSGFRSWRRGRRDRRVARA